MPGDSAASPDPPRVFESRFRARSYELDSFGHVNHAVFLHWFEQARFEALEAGGLPAEAIAARGWAVVVARVEVDFEKEVRFGDELLVRTHVEEIRNTSMTLVQELVRTGRSRPAPDGAARDAGPVRAAEARVVAVWLRGGRPGRIPPEVRSALGVVSPERRPPGPRRP